jgi:hypothetical protein
VLTCQLRLSISRQSVSTSMIYRNEMNKFPRWTGSMAMHKMSAFGFVDQYRRNYRRNLRFGPLLSEGFRFALVGLGNI